MQPSEHRSFTAMEVLAASLAMSLTADELEWLWKELARRAAEKRYESAVGHHPVLAAYRDAWAP